MLDMIQYSIGSWSNSTVLDILQFGKKAGFIFTTYLLSVNFKLPSFVSEPENNK